MGFFKKRKKNVTKKLDDITNTFKADKKNRDLWKIKVREESDKKNKIFRKKILIELGEVKEWLESNLNREFYIYEGPYGDFGGYTIWLSDPVPMNINEWTFYLWLNPSPHDDSIKLSDCIVLLELVHKQGMNLFSEGTSIYKGEDLSIALDRLLESITQSYKNQLEKIK